MTYNKLHAVLTDQGYHALIRRGVAMSMPEIERLREEMAELKASHDHLVRLAVVR